MEYVIVGHSERRNYLGETDEIISKKIKSVFENGLIPVLCVGETLEQKEKGLAEEIVRKQLEKDLKNVSSFMIQDSRLIVAYEPIWAIGTGNDCQPKDALEIIKHIKNILDSRFKIHDSRLLYGGSVDPGDATNYLKYPEIEGALVGGASLKTEEFKKLSMKCLSQLKPNQLKNKTCLLRVDLNIEFEKRTLFDSGNFADN